MPRPLHFGGYRPSARSRHPDPNRPPNLPPTARYEEELAAHPNSLLDYDRLPAAGELRGMELAWREIAVEREVASGEVLRRTGWAFVASLVLGAVFLAAPERAPLTRPVMVGILWALTYVGLLTLGRRPLAFYRDWLYTFPRLTPATRTIHPRRHPLFLMPSPGRFLALAVGTTLLWSEFPGFTVLAVSAAAGLGFLYEARARAETKRREGLAARGRSYDTRRHASLLAELLPLYISHGVAPEEPRVPPGVWRHYRSAENRLKDLPWPIVLLGTTLAVALCFGLAPDGLAYALRGKPMDQVAAVIAAARTSPISAVRTLWAFDSGSAFVLALWAISFPTTASLGILVFLFEPALRRLARRESDIESDDGLDATEPDVEGKPTPRSEMQWHIDRTRQSTHTAVLPRRGEETRERDHLFLGEEPFQRFPILLHEDILERHCYLSGSTGAGKTHLGLLPMMLQLLRPKGDPENPEPPPPMVILDLKGDWAMFHTLRLEVAKRWWTDPATKERRQQAFRFFTLEKGHATDYFNPFSSVGLDRITPGQLAEILLDVFNMNHGSGYGRGYYSEINRGLLHQYLQTIRRDPRRWANLSFQEMARECMPAPGERGPGNNPLELVAHIAALTESEQLCTPHDALDDAAKERAILMPRLLEERQVAYFWLPVMSGSRTTRDVALLVLWSLWRAAQRRTSTHPVYLFVDELQRVVSKGFSDMMTQTRSPARIRLVSTSQSPAQLNTPDEDFRELIITNAGVRYIFQMSNELDIKRLIQASGTQLEEQHQFSQTQDPETGNITPGVTTTTVRVPRLTINDIIAMNKDAHRFFLDLPQQGAGYSQFRYNPIVVEADFILHPDVYKERDRPNTWPAPVPGQHVPSLDQIDLETDSRIKGERVNVAGDPPVGDFKAADDEFQARYRDFDEKIKTS